MQAILAGASGLVGSRLARELGNRPGTNTVALVRKRVETLPPGMQQPVADFAHLHALAPVQADSVFCALGTTIAKAGSREAFRRVDYDTILELGRYGRRCQARQFLLVSSVDAFAGSRNFYLRVKGETERDLSALGYETVHIFRPSFLLGERGEKRVGEALGIAAIRAIGWVLAGPLSKYRGIQASVVARAMVAASGAGTGRTGPAGVRVYQYREMVALAAGGGA